MIGRFSSQRTGLHGRTLLKRFFALFSGRTAAFRVCSVPTGTRFCIMWPDDMACDLGKGQWKTNSIVPQLYRRNFMIPYGNRKKMKRKNEIQFVFLCTSYSWLNPLLSSALNWLKWFGNSATDIALKKVKYT